MCFSRTPWLLKSSNILLGLHTPHSEIYTSCKPYTNNSPVVHLQSVGDLQRRPTQAGKGRQCVFLSEFMLNIKMDLLVDEVRDNEI